MKKLIGILLLLFLLASGIYLGYFFYSKSQKPVEVYETVKPKKRDIILKTVATGTIVPRKEIELKANVSGVVDKVFVEPGQEVASGDLIAKIRIIPNVVSLNNAQARLKQAKINFNNAKQELDRQKQLYDQKVITNFDYNRFQLDFKLTQQEVEAAENNLQLIKEGATKNASNSTNLVKATAAGLILDVPVEEGNFVTETNNFNAGTTIAFVANMKEMVFEGSIDESEVGKIKEGMKLSIQVAALEDQKFDAVLEYISPKGVEEEGAVNFEVKAAIELVEGVFLRAGYSANADILLSQKPNVLSINERELLFEGDKIFVEIEKSKDVFEKVEVKTGLSDGIHIHIENGIDESVTLKKQVPQLKKKF